MKRIIFLFFVLSIVKVQAQLSGTALALYNECYNADVMQGQYATNNGAQVVGTADGKSFYLKWIPAGATASVTPMLVTLHGSGGRAFVEFFNWHQRAQSKGVGIIALQWYKGTVSNSYFSDDTLYDYIKTALSAINYPPNKALLHGFSRGSARSYALAFNDLSSQGGNNYFCTIMSNAGKPDSLYPLYTQINLGTYGHTFFTGKKWGMFCGADDSNVAQSGCQGMNMAKNWVIANGGSVGLNIQGPSPLGHDGFHTVPAYIDSCLNYYLNQCYNITTDQKQIIGNTMVQLFPNPAQDYIYLKIPKNTKSSTIIIYDGLGRTVYEKIIDDALIIDTKLWSKGIYYYRFKNEGIESKMNKLVLN